MYAPDAVQASRSDQEAHKARHKDRPQPVAAGLTDNNARSGADTAEQGGREQPAEVTLELEASVTLAGSAGSNGAQKQPAAAALGGAVASPVPAASDRRGKRTPAEAHVEQLLSQDLSDASSDGEVDARAFDGRDADAAGAALDRDALQRSRGNDDRPSSRPAPVGGDGLASSGADGAWHSALDGTPSEAAQGDDNHNGSSPVAPASGPRAPQPRNLSGLDSQDGPGEAYTMEGARVRSLLHSSTDDSGSAGSEAAEPSGRKGNGRVNASGGGASRTPRRRGQAADGHSVLGEDIGDWEASTPPRLPPQPTVKGRAAGRPTPTPSPPGVGGAEFDAARPGADGQGLAHGRAGEAGVTGDTGVTTVTGAEGVRVSREATPVTSINSDGAPVLASSLERDTTEEIHEESPGTTWVI